MPKAVIPSVLWMSGYPLSVARETMDLEGTTTQVGPGRSGNSTWPGPRPTSKGTTELMYSVPSTSDTPPLPTLRLGMSTCDGCPECIYNLQPPTTSTALKDGYRNTYCCSDCGATWTTEWAA